MKKKGIFVGLLIGIVGIVLLLGMTAKDGAAWWPWAKEEKEVLRLALIPAEDPREQIKDFELAKQFLERKLGMKIEMFKAISYTAVIEAMRAGKVDVARFGPFSYILAAERANARAIAAMGYICGRVGVYHTVFITHRDSGLRSIDDIKARAGELTVSFPDPASTSGHLIPRGFMESIGISVDEAFKEIVFSGGHDGTMLAVGAQKVDWGATNDGRFNRAVEQGVLCPEDIIVIWKSDGIPNAPVAVRGDLDEALIQRIQQAYVDMAQKDPEAFASALKVDADRGETFVAVTDADYEFIRQLAIGLGKL